MHSPKPTLDAPRPGQQRNAPPRSQGGSVSLGSITATATTTVIAAIIATVIAIATAAVLAVAAAVCGGGVSVGGGVAAAAGGGLRVCRGVCVGVERRPLALGRPPSAAVAVAIVTIILAASVVRMSSVSRRHAHILPLTPFLLR